jgi:hypothetical protein
MKDVRPPLALGRALTPPNVSPMMRVSPGSEVGRGTERSTHDNVRVHTDSLACSLAGPSRQGPLPGPNHSLLGSASTPPNARPSPGSSGSSPTTSARHIPAGAPNSTRPGLGSTGTSPVNAPPNLRLQQPGKGNKTFVRGKSCAFPHSWAPSTGLHTPMGSNSTMGGTLVINSSLHGGGASAPVSPPTSLPTGTFPTSIGGASGELIYPSFLCSARAHLCFPCV